MPSYIETAESKNGRAGAAGHKLEKCSLVRFCHLCNDLPQHLYNLRVRNGHRFLPCGPNGALHGIACVGEDLRHPIACYLQQSIGGALSNIS